MSRKYDINKRDINGQTLIDYAVATRDEDRFFRYLEMCAELKTEDPGFLIKFAFEWKNEKMIRAVLDGLKISSSNSFYTLKSTILRGADPLVCEML